ncbi:hypothetical protein [Streptomyces carpaticus]|uniref:hypothetical protein n=1 Tax=Streptomyces carpaticus TaxID=285558 RepID=UPI0031F8E017
MLASTCRSCAAPIIWAVTPRQQRMPLDALPDPSGNVAVHRDVAGRLRARVVSGERPTLEGSERLHMPHFASCPARRKAAR